MTGIYNPGQYTIEARGFALNGQDTGVFKELTVTVVNPCLSATLSIDNSIFKTTPEVSLIQYVNYDAKTLSWTD